MLNALELVVVRRKSALTNALVGDFESRCPPTISHLRRSVELFIMDHGAEGSG